eukprot:8143038-Pyramimonas_sp.AAC.2
MEKGRLATWARKWEGAHSPHGICNVGVSGQKSGRVNVACASCHLNAARGVGAVEAGAIPGHLGGVPPAANHSIPPCHSGVSCEPRATRVPPGPGEGRAQEPQVHRIPLPAGHPPHAEGPMWRRRARHLPVCARRCPAANELRWMSSHHEHTRGTSRRTKRQPGLQVFFCSRTQARKRTEVGRAHASSAGRGPWQP